MAQGLVLRQISKRYPGAVSDLGGVDLTIRPGEVVAVTGGNGSGKSTLLRIIVGLSRRAWTGRRTRSWEN